MCIKVRNRIMKYLFFSMEKDEGDHVKSSFCHQKEEEMFPKDCHRGGGGSSNVCEECKEHGVKSVHPFTQTWVQRS